jgi:hypothetical protein
MPKAKPDMTRSLQNLRGAVTRATVERPATRQLATGAMNLDDVLSALDARHGVNGGAVRYCDCDELIIEGERAKNARSMPLKRPDLRLVTNTPILQTRAQ